MQIHLFKNEALAIYPKVNLVANIGFDAEGTHTKWNDGRGDKSVFPILPLTHPKSMTVDYAMDADCFAKRQSRGWIVDTLSFLKHLMSHR